MAASLLSRMIICRTDIQYVAQTLSDSCRSNSDLQYEQLFLWEKCLKLEKKSSFYTNCRAGRTLSYENVDFYSEYPHDACNVGDVVENDCNLCVCNNKTVFECYTKKCDVSAQKVEDDQKPKCKPKMVYVRNDIICICTKNSQWPHPRCDNALQSLQSNDNSVIKPSCEPNSYVKVDCNVCRCNSNGEVDTEYCTRNNCTQIYLKGARKNIPLPKNVHGHCEPKNWYSVAPCQFCFCVNTNKLVCNTADFYVNKLQLGKYNLNICGKDLIKEAIDLIPDENTNLRQGIPVHKSTKLTTLPVTTTQTIPTPQFIPIDNNPPLTVREVITHKHREDQDDSTEYYDEDEVKPVNYKVNIAISAASTNRPNNQDKDKTRTSADNVDKNDDYSAQANAQDTPAAHGDRVGRPLSLKSAGPQPAEKIYKNTNKDATGQLPKTLRDRKSKDNYVLDVFVPNVLESLFNLEMRKSMMKVVPSDNCVPGSIENIKCNTCFCMKSGKKLCTEKPCE